MKPASSSISSRHWILFIIVGVLLGICISWFLIFGTLGILNFQGHNIRRISPLVNSRHKLAVIIHTGAKNYNTRVRMLENTWLSITPPWATVDFYTTVKDGAIPSAENNTILVVSKEPPHRGNHQFFGALEEVLRKYPTALNILKVDDDSFVNWRALWHTMNDHGMLQYRDTPHQPLFIPGTATVQFGMTGTE